MSSAQAPRSRRSTLISHPTLLGERWMPTPGWEHLQGHCLDETLSFVNPALTTGRYHHCGRPRQAARATYRLRAHALLRRDGPCARWILGVGKGLTPSLPRRIGARAVRPSADRPSLMRAPQVIGATSDHSHLLPTPTTQAPSHVAGPRGVVASIDLSTESRVLQLYCRPAG